MFGVRARKLISSSSRFDYFKMISQCPSQFFFTLVVKMKEDGTVPKFKSEESVYDADGLDEVIHPICCGLDVHKTWVYAAILIYDFEKKEIHWITNRFNTFPKGLQALAAWLMSHNCPEACMESTGQYWYPVFDALEAAGLKPVVSHPKYTKPLKGKKSDPNDAKWIAKAFSCGRVRCSFIPPKKFRDLRSLERYFKKVSDRVKQAKNRTLNCLTNLGLKLDDVFSDVFGESSRDIINTILAHPGEYIDVRPLVRKGCKTPISTIQEAVSNKIDPEADRMILLKLRMTLKDLDDASEEKKMLADEMTRELSGYGKLLELIRTVPGFASDPFTAVRVLIEIGPDMKVFPTAKHFCSWVGVCPHHDSSANKVKGRKISKGGAYLKPLLFSIAMAVVRSKKHPEITRRFNRIKNRRGYMKAIIAICRMFLTAIWNILRKGEPYNADGYMSMNEKPNKVLSVSQALAFVRSRGYVIAPSETVALTTTDP